MSKSSLLAEAIADAKEFKKLAIENAKLTLAESVSPQIAALVSAKLNEDLNEKEEVEEDMNDEDTNEDFDALMEKLKKADPVKFEAMNVSLAEKKEEVPAEEKEEEKEEVPAADESLDIDAALSEIEKEQVAEKKEEVPAEEKEEEKKEVPAEDELDEDYIDRILAEVEAEADETEDQDEKKEEEAPIEEGVSDVAKQIKDFIANLTKGLSPEDMKRAIESGTGYSSLSSNIKEVEKEAPAEKEEEEVTAEQMLELRDQLLEMNLLNAKLVYQNKLLISENFSDEQKARIIVAFDKVKTVNEAKLIFETLNVKTSQKTTARPIAESLGFRRIGAPIVINESKDSYDHTDPTVQLMMERAGIKKQK